MKEISILKNDIANYKRSELIRLALTTINKYERSDTLIPIWNYLTLINLAFLYAPESDIIQLPSLSKAEFIRLNNLIQKIQDHYLINNFGFNTNKNTRKTFSILSNQQFWQYNTYPDLDLARQLILFIDLDRHKAFQNLILSQIGIPIKTFIDLSFGVNLCLQQNDQNFLTQHQEKMFEKFYGNYFKKYLDLLTLKSKADLIKIQPNDKLTIQVFDSRHYILKPFIKLQDKHWVASFGNFQQSIKYFLYDYLRTEAKTFFDKKFSSQIFEGYVKKMLTELDLPFQDESQLKKILPEDSKVVDFLIENTIYLDCKATELNANKATNPKDTHLQGAVKNSIIKGCKQIYECAYNNKSNLKEQKWGIIVTYKPMYLGQSKDFTEEILHTFFEEAPSEYLDVIPIDNLFILSLDQWEGLLGIIKKQCISLSELLTRIKGLLEKENLDFDIVLQKIEEEIPNFDFIKIRYKNYVDDLKANLAVDKLLQEK